MEPITLMQAFALLGLVLLCLSTGERMHQAVLGALMIMYAMYLTLSAPQPKQKAPTHHQAIQTSQHRV